MTIQNELMRSFSANHHRVAIEKGDITISFGQLLDNANRITQFLCNHFPTKGTMVGLMLADRIEAITALVGTLNAGHIFVLLDPKLPESRLKSMIKELNLGIVISSQKGMLTDRIKDESILEVEFDKLQMLSAGGGTQLTDFHSTDPIYVYFTSGSTGVPKGIIGRNASLLQFVNWEIKHFNVAEGVRFSQFISPYFDAFLRDVFVPLLAGGTICIPPDDQAFYLPENVIRWIDQTRINMIHCVPSVFRLFNDQSLTSGHFPNLTHVLLSGEKIVPSELQRWYDLFGKKIKLMNLYGATETTMIRACYEIDPQDARKTRIPIGKPIDGTKLLVVDEEFKPRHVLIPGELYIVSNYTSAGYLNDPELTRQKFINITDQDFGETIAFKTGDIARYLPDGNIDLMGREDRQIKVRGIRIELDEIENVIHSSGLVELVIAGKYTSEKNEDSLVTFIKPNEGATDIEGQVTDFIKLHLPDYMVPSAVVSVDQFPLLTNGKINFNALTGMLFKTSVIAPANAIEERILEIWKEILGDKEISTDESFQRVGGNSLSIMKLVGKLYKEYKVRVSLSDLFENLTIQKQAKLIEVSSINDLFVIKTAEIKESYPLSSAQERMYYNYLLDKNGTSYNMPMAWQIEGEYDKDKIKQVFHSLITRHESLRTSFKMNGDHPVQIVNNSFEFELQEIEWPQEDINQAIQDFIKPFDLESTSLMRCAIIKSPRRTLLLVDFHHIICDGISHAALHSDFLTLYRGGELKPLRVQYKDYAEWELQFKSTAEYTEQREFWLSTFYDGVPQLDLPITEKEFDHQSGHGGNTYFEISLNDVSPLLDHLKKNDLTVFSGLLSAYFIFLSQLTGQEDIVVGTSASGRIQEEMENVVGMFLKPLPIRQVLNANLTFTQLIREVYDFMIQANSKQSYDLTNILEEINLGKASPIKNLFDAFFVFQNFDLNRLKTDNQEFSVFDFENKTAKHPLSLFIIQNETALHCRLEYSVSCFSRSDIDLLITQFKLLLEKIAQNMEASVSSLISSDVSVPEFIEEDISFSF